MPKGELKFAILWTAKMHFNWMLLFLRFIFSKWRKKIKTGKIGAEQYSHVEYRAWKKISKFVPFSYPCPCVIVALLLWANASCKRFILSPQKLYWHDVDLKVLAVKTAFLAAFWANPFFKIFKYMFSLLCCDKKQKN